MMNQPFRIGHGFDLHRLEPNLPLIIGGHTFEHDKGCAAHSDGDVLLHALTDAILGALAEPDIGQLFPDNDPQNKNADSKIFLQHALTLMNTAGYAINNIDITIILQAPKLSPHKQTIKDNLTTLLNCHASQINIKGKTHEHVDAIGHNDAIAAHAVVLLAKTSALHPHID